MKITKVVRFMAFMSMFLLLTGCELFNQDPQDPGTDIKLTLKIGDKVHEVYSNLDANTEVDLPIVTMDSQVFLGWREGETTYFDTYTIKKSATLQAVFDDVEAYFTYSVVLSESTATLIKDTITIDHYIGSIETVVIPKTIDGNYVSKIGVDAFKDSKVVHVHIPMDVNVGFHAFYQSLDLESVHFYGDYEINYEDNYNHLELADVVSRYTNDCSQNINNVVVGVYPLGESCPIKEITNIRSMNVGGQTYSVYTVILSPVLPKDVQIGLGSFAFEGANKLHTLEIPKGETLFFVDSLYGVPNLETLLLDDTHPHFKLQDGVLFNYSQQSLLYYPSGLKNTTYTIPTLTNSVIPIWENPYLETIIIPEAYQGSLPARGLVNLKAFQVNENNPRYHSVDGVLYTDDTLIAYPANKEGTHFEIPNNITIIDDYAFYQNQNLESIDLNQVTRIGHYAFAEAVSLLELSLPNTVTTLGNGIIHKSSIRTLILNRSFVLNGSLPTLVSSNLGSIPGEGFKIYVPNDSLDAYKESDIWDNYSDHIYPLSEYVD